MKYGATTKIIFNKNSLVKKKCHFTFFCFVNYAGANQCMDLKQTKKHIQEDSENMDHLNSDISNSKLKKNI